MRGQGPRAHADVKYEWIQKMWSSFMFSIVQNGNIHVNFLHKCDMTIAIFYIIAIYFILFCLAQVDLEKGGCE